MVEPTCPNPEFRWNTVLLHWEACLRCARPAWEHEQADILQDVRNFAKQVCEGLPPGSFPPAMKRPDPDA